MTKPMLDPHYVKYTKQIVKKKEREDKETKNRNRRGSITLPQPGIDIEDMVLLGKLMGVK